MSITLVVQEVHFVYRIAVNGGWGGGMGEVGAQDSVPSAALPKQQSLANNMTSWLIFVFNKFYYPFKITDRFLSC